MTDGSYFAVLKTGRHMTGTRACISHGEFEQFVRHALYEHRYNIAHFVYGWGGELQIYTPSEVREVFLNAAPTGEPAR